MPKPNDLDNLPNAGIISLEDGKYQFELDTNGILIRALRHGEDWPPGMEYRFNKCVMGMLWYIQRLEVEKQLTEPWARKADPS